MSFWNKKKIIILLDEKDKEEKLINHLKFISVITKYTKSVIILYYLFLIIPYFLL